MEESDWSQPRWNLHATEVNDSVYELHRPEGDPSMQVIFFHGLQLDNVSEMHLSTWESEDGSCLWPKTWLAEEFPDAHILVVSYHESLSRAGETFDMYLISENLIDDLLQEGIGQSPYSPVVLVGHSFGGLVIKSVLSMQAQKAHISKTRGDQLKRFLDNVKGIMYYGTPHRGSLIIGRAEHILGGRLFEYFRTLNSNTARLNEEFRQLHGKYPKWQINGLGEGRPVQSGLFCGVLVVKEGSSRDGETFNIDGTADHFTISKPPKKTSRRFRLLKNLLVDISTESKEEKRKQDAKKIEDARAHNIQPLPMHMKGLDSRLQQVMAKLESGRSLGLVGMGGLGKTTLAKVVFNKLLSSFEYTCFVSDVKAITENRKDLKKEAWRNMHRDGKKASKEQEWFKLRKKKLLLVFDNVSGDSDVGTLLEIANDSAPESRFIVTSRNAEVFKKFDEVYEIPFLNEYDSRELFASHAFPNEAGPPPQLEVLMGEIVKKCEGLPLTLVVLGEYLNWKPDNEDWQETLDALIRADDVSSFDERLWAKLRPSYDGLSKKEQQIFLDAATFFSNDWSLHDAKVAWRKSYGEGYKTTSERLPWKTLVARFLVYNVKEDERVGMHEQLRSMGRKIARESGNNCRIWERETARELLKSKDENDAKDCQAFQLCGNGCDDAAVHVRSTSVGKLRNVKFLELDDSVVIDGSVRGLSVPSKLVLLKCVGLKLLNPGIQSSLVFLDLDLGNETLPCSIGQLSGLRVLNLSNAFGQVNIPNEIGNLSELERLRLAGWKRLKALPETFGKLSNLKHLVFTGCEELLALPASFGDLVALEHLEFSSCTNLAGLPESFGCLQLLKQLEIHGCDEILTLPKRFGDLSALTHLKFEMCNAFFELPELFGDLGALEHLEFLCCEKLQWLPESFGRLRALKHLQFQFCSNLRALPDSFGCLSALKHLQFQFCSNLRDLPDSFGCLSALKHLYIYDCEEMSALPESFRDLSALKHLHFGHCELYVLPQSFGDLLC